MSVFDLKQILQWCSCGLAPLYTQESQLFPDLYGYKKGVSVCVRR